MRISTLLLMPVPKDFAAARVEKIRADAAKKLTENFAAKLEKWAKDGKIGRGREGKPSQKDAEKILGMPQSMISQILAGNRIPGADYLAVMCEMFVASADDMLGLPSNESDRARRLIEDLLDENMQRRVYELLRDKFEPAPRELGEAARETTPSLPPPEGIRAGHSGDQPATKRKRLRRSRR